MEDPEPPEDEPTAFRLMAPDRIHRADPPHGLPFRFAGRRPPAGTGQRPSDHHPHPGYESA